ncbi:MAG: hypothetical protein ACJAU0_001507 [Flavobacteriales bacterium]
MSFIHPIFAAQSLTMNRTLQQLANELSEDLNRLENGDLKLDEIAPLTDTAREMYERLVALRYVAIEQLVKPHANKDGSFRLGATHPNQTSLIDAIEEVSKLDDVKKAPNVIQESLFEPSFGAIEDSADEISSSTLEHDVDDDLRFEETKEEAKVPEESDSEVIEIQLPLPPEKIIPEATSEKKDDLAPIKPSKPKLHSPEKVIKEPSHVLQTADDSLAQKLRKTPIDDLRKAIGLNQKFLLINELFDGDADTYNASIDQLNSSSGFETASGWIHSELRNRFQWDDESATVQDFLDLVERRFL